MDEDWGEDLAGVRDTDKRGEGEEETFIDLSLLSLMFLWFVDFVDDGTANIALCGER